jgi:uncharacterized lipoprotein YmbA
LRGVSRFAALPGLIALAAMMLAASAMAGCHLLDPQPDPTQFYVLTPIGGASQPLVDTAKSGTTIGLGPVTLPDYLDEPWIVTRGEGNRLYVSVHDQWAEPLRTSFKDVLKEDLETAMVDSQIIDFPWYRTTSVDRQIIVDVINFEFNTSNNTAEIRADWRIMNVRTGGTQSRGQYVASQSVAQTSELGRASALSKLVEQLAQTLAQQVRRGPSIAHEEGRTSHRQPATRG